MIMYLYIFIRVLLLYDGVILLYDGVILYNDNIDGEYEYEDYIGVDWIHDLIDEH